MKTKLLLFNTFFFVMVELYAQAGATVYARNLEISDHLDLKAVASIFGESSTLQDFERRLNEPNYQISNLDLNGDNKVDYLRVIETVDTNMHLIVIQSVLSRDTYQDVASIDVVKNNYNTVSVQVVGNSYLYGSNYIYEPVFVKTPIIYSSFWVTNYNPYYSIYRWGYYPSYYVAWSPYPLYRYRNNITIYVNTHNHYNYVTSRKCAPIATPYHSNGYERAHPNNSFNQRNSNLNNRYELDQRRVSYTENTTNNNSNSAYSKNKINTDYGQNTNASYTNHNSKNRKSNVVTTPYVERTKNYNSTVPENSRITTSRSYNTPYTTSVRTQNNSTSRSSDTYSNSNRTLQSPAVKVESQPSSTSRSNSNTTLGQARSSSNSSSGRRL